MKVSMWGERLIILVRFYFFDHGAQDTDRGTGSWFAWANSVFAQTILDLAARKPHLIFGVGSKPFVIA